MSPETIGEIFMALLKFWLTPIGFYFAILFVKRLIF
jgi:hypothetical protein